MTEERLRADRAAATGRKIGTVAFGIAVGTFTAVCAAQIMTQVWGTPRDTSAAPDCYEGLDGLIRAVRRARRAAGAEPAGERAALARFREQLQPEWAYRAGLGRSCRDDPEALRALRDVDRLRYAEEHAVRYESVDLARRRRRVAQIEARLVQTRKTHEVPGLPE
jgi:hypothetical protein